jgi:histone acetyltransferase (RNA polymerase elongator complex component)
MRPLIIPFFIPHAGCPHTCLFCDQHLISGEQAALPSAELIAATVEEWLARSPGRPAEVAFYGGSFTLLPQSRQQQMLQAVLPFLATGRVHGVRVSTRPDALDTATLDFLAAHQVRTIEIGVQSLNDEVLQRTGRGHSGQQALEAIQRVAGRDFAVGAQLLPGLPGDTKAKALDSLQGVLAAGAHFIRIYPAVVLAGTGLARLYQQGSYCPPDLEQGTQLCAALLREATRAGCPVIRIGLQADDGLVSGQTILAGCWHPALGHLVKDELFFELVLRLSEQLPAADPVLVHCHPQRVSEVRGHGNRNLQRWRQAGIAVSGVQPDPLLDQHHVRLEALTFCFSGSWLTTY